jgi:hypothetical protein
VEADVLLAGEVEVEARVLEDDPDAPADRGRVAVEVVAGDPDGPDVFARVVVRIEIVVVLPAPFGPRKANSSPGRPRRRCRRRRAGRLPVALDEVLDLDDRIHDGSLASGGSVTRVPRRWEHCSRLATL